MKWRMVLSLIVVMILVSASSAGIFGSKKSTKTPAERVTELITTLKTDGDENKRYEAAENLRQFDPVKFPQIIPALVDALNNDPKASVRSEVAQTLGKIRPINPLVGQALEHAKKKDASMRVRIQASSSLMSYRWDGYKETEPSVAMDPRDPPVIDTHKEGNTTKQGPVVVTGATKVTPPSTTVAVTPPTTPATPAPTRSWWRFLPFSSSAQAPTTPPTIPPTPATTTTNVVAKPAVVNTIKTAPPVQSAEPPLASDSEPAVDKKKVTGPDPGPVLAPPKIEPAPAPLILPLTTPPPVTTRSNKVPVNDSGPDLPPPD